jgi:hypothetical protein
MLLACMMTDAGTPWRRAMVSMVSPDATVIAVPPSQLQLPDAAGLRTTDPVTSEAARTPRDGGIHGYGRCRTRLLGLRGLRLRHRCGQLGIAVGSKWIIVETIKSVLAMRVRIGANSAKMTATTASFGTAGPAALAR